jgi:hypothetical protein
MEKEKVKKTRVVDPHWFNADPDTRYGSGYSIFFLIADPDPVSDPGFWRPKIEKIYS